VKHIALPIVNQHQRDANDEKLEWKTFISRKKRKEEACSDEKNQFCCHDFIFKLIF
jgi:hypothetical protein